ncbi:MAG: hypothetical protein WDM96_00050 [Lacunisphaera sp.]
MPFRPCLFRLFLAVILPILAKADAPIGERGRIRREIVPFASDEAVRRIFSVAVDPRGRIVAANGRVLLYDGWTTRELVLPKPVDTGAVAVDARGRIWVGNHEELGWLAEQPDGEWKYTSIRAELPAEKRDYQLLWAVHCLGDTVVFVASHQVMIWREGRFDVVSLPNVRRLFSSTLGASCYVWQREGVAAGTHLWRFAADGTREKILTLPGLFSGYDVLAADSRSIEFVAATVQRYDLAGRRLTEVLPPLGPGRQVAAIAGVSLPDGERLIGTADHGLFGFDPAGHPVWEASVASGELPDNGIEAVASDAHGMVWGMTARGLAGLEADPAVTTWRAEEGLPVTVNAVARFEGQLFIATPVGLHQLVPDEAGGVAKFKPTASYAPLYNDLALLGAGQLLVVGTDSHARGKSGWVWGVEPQNMEAGRFAFQPPGYTDLLVWADLNRVRVLRAPRAGETSPSWPEVWAKKLALVDRAAPWRGLEFVVANNSGAIDLYSLRRTGDGVEEAVPARRLTPAGGLGRVLRFEQQGGWLLAFTRTGAWRWRETLDRFEPLPTDAPAGLVPFAFRFDGAEQGWAVATLARDALGNAEGTRQLLLRVAWQPDGSVRGLQTPPVAVVDDIDRLTCAFSETGVWWLGGTGGLARVDLAALARAAPLQLGTAPYLVTVRQSEGRARDGRGRNDGQGGTQLGSGVWLSATQTSAAGAI